MAHHSPAGLRAFVRRNTRLGDVAGVPGIRLHLGDDVMALYRLAGDELGEADPGLPFWAFAWAGGLAVVQYLAEHPEAVAGKRVLDVASGSGLCAIAAIKAGAESAHAIDVDPLSEAAVYLNSRANGVRIGFSRRDLLGGEPPDCDVILAGDVCYEETMADRMVAWLRIAADQGIHVLIGDPGRTYLPAGLERLAAYRVRTSLELENSETKESAVYTLLPEASHGAPKSAVGWEGGRRAGL
jgi:predicted nicotinamide N-methyase